MRQKKQRARFRVPTIVLSLLVVFLLATLIILPNLDVLLHAQGDLVNRIAVEGYFWMPNGGWMQMQGDNFGVGMNKDGRVVGSTVYYDFHGYAWASNFGWISFRAADDSYGVTVQTDVLSNPREGNGPWRLNGFAWASNFGWINFDVIDSAPGDDLNPNEPQVTIGVQEPGNPVVTAQLRGYAWSPNIGWVDLSHATIPSWKDISTPEIINWSAVAEVASPSQPYLGGVYTEEMSGYSGFTNHNFIWVADNTKFNLQLDSRDNSVYFNTLFIANLNTVDYYWKDKLRFKPRVNGYSGSLPNPAISGDFQRNSDPPYDQPGENPTAVNVPGVWKSGDPIPTWSSVSHFWSALKAEQPTPEVRELRVNAIDTGWNSACPDGDYQWGNWDELTGCNVAKANGPLVDRVGIAIDGILPTASLYYAGHQYQLDEHIPTNKPLVLTYTYGDTNSSGARWAQISWSFDKSSWKVLGTWDENVGRDSANRNFFLPAVGGTDGDYIYFRFEVYDNVGNLLDKTLRLIVDNTAPPDIFQAQDPKDFDPERTRFQYVNMHVPKPASAEELYSVSFSNDGAVYWGDEIIYGTKLWPIGESLNVEWDLNWGGVQPKVLPGGNRIIYAKFSDRSIPPNSEIKSYIIKAPWFQAEGGDIHAGDGVGTTETYPGIAAYSGFHNATYRITADGTITNQITSTENWLNQNYAADFIYPGPAPGSIAQIDWDTLVGMAGGQGISEEEIVKSGEINFDQYETGIVIAKVPDSTERVFQIGSPGQNVTIKGKGTLLVNGSVYVAGNLYYEDAPEENVSEVDSFGVVTKRSDMLGTVKVSRGNLYIDSSVNHMVGSYILGIGNCNQFIANCTDTGVIHTSVQESIFGKPRFNTNYISGNDLDFYGLVIARGFDLNRYSVGSQNFLLNADFSDTVSQQSTFLDKPLDNYPQLPLKWSLNPKPPIEDLDYGTSPSLNLGAENLGNAIFWMSAQRPLNGSVSLEQPVVIPALADIPEDTTVPFTISVYLKANRSLEKFVSLSIGSEPCASDITIDREWRRYQCSFEKIDSGVKQPFKMTFNFDQPSLLTRIVHVAAPQVEFENQASSWHRKYDDNEVYRGSSEHFYYDGRTVISTPPGFSSVSSSSWGETVAD